MTDQLLFGGLRTISVSFQSKTAIQTSLPVSSLKAAWEMWPRGVALLLLLTPTPSPSSRSPLTLRLNRIRWWFSSPTPSPYSN